MELLHDFDAECFSGSGGGRRIISTPPKCAGEQAPTDLLAGAWQVPVVAVAGCQDTTPGTVTPPSPTPLLLPLLLLATWMSEDCTCIGHA